MEAARVIVCEVGLWKMRVLLLVTKNEQCVALHSMNYFGAKSGSLHSTLNFFVLHKRLPHKTGALILGHQHGDSEVDPKHIRVIPIN